MKIIVVVGYQNMYCITFLLRFLLNDNPDPFLLPNKEKVTSWTYIGKIGLVIK